MGIEKLYNTFADLIQHIQADGYSENYILGLKREVNWIAKKKFKEGIHSYKDACRFRGNHTDSTDVQRWYCHCHIIK